MLKIYAEIPATDKLYPGALVAVDVVIAEHSNVIVVPFDAVITKSSKSYLVIVDGQSIAKIRPVKTGLEGEDQIEILSGLREGELVAFYGHNELVDGTKVKLVSE